jgi:MFS family permease
VALVLLALDRTGSGAFGGALVAALLVPHVVAAPLMGTLADRTLHPHRLYAGALTGFGAALAGCAMLAGRTPEIAVLAVVAAGGCLATMVTGGLTSLLSTLVPEPQLPRVFGLDSVSYNIAGICGPAVAGLLAATVGPPGATLLLAGSVAAGGLLLCTLPIRARERAAGEPAPPRMTSGVLAIWRSPTLRAVTVATGVGQLGIGALPLVTALLATRQHSPALAGTLIAAFAAGGLLGSLAYARHPVGQRRPHRVVMIGLLATAMPMALATLTPDGIWSAALFAAAGFCTGPVFSCLLATRQRHAPPAVHTQVFTLGAGVKTTAAAIGAALAGQYAFLGPGSLLLAVAGSQLAGATVGGVLLRKARPTTVGTSRAGQPGRAWGDRMPRARS